MLMHDVYWCNTYLISKQRCLVRYPCLEELVVIARRILSLCHLPTEEHKMHNKDYN